MNYMNTNETTGETSKNYEGDKLDRIFAAQKGLMANYKTIAEDHYSKIFNQPVKFSDHVWEGHHSNLHTKAGNYLIRDMVNACVQELGEAVQVMKNWKAWKQSEMESDENHFREEMIDALHFFIEAMIFAGMTADDMHDLYFKKNEVNHFRQETKY